MPVVWLASGLLVLLGACSSGDDAGSGPAEATADVAAEATTPEVPPPARPGEGTMVVSGTALVFEVTECRLEPDPAEPEGARALLEATGTGETARGDAFTVEVQRFATSLNDVVTYTDTIAYTDPARILQAQRIEVGGQVTDLRDPDATSALLRPRADGLSGAGLAGAPGDAADDEGVIGIAVDLTCP